MIAGQLKFQNEWKLTFHLFIIFLWLSLNRYRRGADAVQNAAGAVGDRLSAGVFPVSVCCLRSKCVDVSEHNFCFG